MRKSFAQIVIGMLPDLAFADDAVQIGYSCAPPVIAG